MSRLIEPSQNQFNTYFALEAPLAEKLIGKKGWAYTVHKDFNAINTAEYGNPSNRQVEPFYDPGYQTSDAEIWYHIAKRSKGVEFTNVYFDATYMKQWIYTVGLGLYENGQFEGMVGVDILAGSFFKDVESATLNNVGGLFVVDLESGKVLTKMQGSGLTVHF